MTTKLSGRAATLAIGLLMGLCSPSFAGVFDAPPADNAAATAPASPDAQAAPANPAATAEQGNPTAAPQDEVKQPVIVTQQQQPEQPAARANPVVAGSQNASWDQTTLIGKIFIGFGALLTVASAARMFMA
jgi:uncharacterized membrane protein